MEVFIPKHVKGFRYKELDKVDTKLSDYSFIGKV